jgi:thymidylate synthase (FAD)
MKVLNAGELQLVDMMGSDLSVVQAARISNGAAMPDWRGEPDEKLIKFLAEHGHMTPFEHATFKFYVDAPIFVIREWQRHRTFSYNEMSARYKKLRPKFFFPKEVRIQDEVNRQSSVPVVDDVMIGAMNSRLELSYHTAWTQYEYLLEMGVAREIARSVLPVGIYSEMYVTGNLRNWMHFYNLRSTNEAQYEIKQYALEVGRAINNHVPLSFAALSRQGV